MMQHHDNFVIQKSGSSMTCLLVVYMASVMAEQLSGVDRGLNIATANRRLASLTVL